MSFPNHPAQASQLPDHPNLDHLRRQAKGLRDAARAGDKDAVARIVHHVTPRADRPVALSTAQYVIAREYGFASWPRLKAEVDERVMTLPGRVSAFLAASVTGRVQEAVRRYDQRVAGFDIRTAAVLGDADRVTELLAARPSSATEPDTDQGWPPLLYVCHSHWHHIDPSRADGLLAVTRLLLDAGADPETNNGRRRRGGGYRSALYGAAGIANNPAITGLLLDRGANPNDGESLYHSVYLRDHACLRVLLAHGVWVPGTNALGAAASIGDVEALRLLIDAAPSGHLADPLAVATDNETVAILLAAGANPNATNDDGISLLRSAIRRGNTDAATTLLRHGAVDDSGVVDRFLGACARADRDETTRLLHDDPELLGRLSEEDLSVLVGAAGHASLPALELMVDFGFLVDTRNNDGETALHQAAYAGRADVVRMLLDRGAEVDPLENRWHSTPLCHATVGSGEQPGGSGDWVATVRTLLAAGASGRGVWVEDKPPTEDVAAILAEHGITEPDESDEPPRQPVDPAVLRDLADRLRVAMDQADLDLMGGLLHPKARWGTCATSDQVLDWYRSRQASGIRAEVRDMLIREDAILAEVIVHEDGLSETVWQEFRVADGAIAEIRAHSPDR
ncbi:MAG TPA: ankyrin repeat domain-containing protein [Pseudonocardiaceae bacterium]